MNNTLEVTHVKNGGQCDLHFDHFDVECNLVKWGVIFGVLKSVKLKSGLKNNEQHTGGHLCKRKGQSDLHFDNFDVGAI